MSLMTFHRVRKSLVGCKGAYGYIISALSSSYITHPRILCFNGHFSRRTWVNRLPINSPTLIPELCILFWTGLNFPCHPLTQSHLVFLGIFCLIPSTSHVIQRLTTFDLISVIFTFIKYKPSQSIPLDHQSLIGLCALQLYILVQIYHI